MLAPSNAYTLTVRQGPQRGKAFSGPKEKDRKPIDPPPIVQLHIRDPSDPASNYLQSPYFFMCCNLCDADLTRPGQLSAALQGEDPDAASRSALAGTLVSSLHRLKDIDNSDGGFFVFPDISVRLEGEFRLRFSLFEMLKTAPKVVFIKSVHTEPFRVYSARNFPGMAESTFLSRSFGDQGVKLRIRKEPRVLGKRSAPPDTSAEPGPPSYLPQRSNYAGMGPQPQQAQTEGYVAAAGYENSPPPKRQRPAIDFGAYVQVERSVQRPYPQQREQYAQYPPREAQVPSRSNFYVPQPGSAQSSEFPLSGQHRTSSTSASSPFASPRTEFPAYGYSNQPQLYQQPRDPHYQYSYPQQHFQASRQAPQPVPPERQVPSSIAYSSGSQMGSQPSYGRQGDQPQSQQQQQYSSDLRYQAQAQAEALAEAQARAQADQQHEQQHSQRATFHNTPQGYTSSQQQSLPRALPPPSASVPPPGALPSLGPNHPLYATTTNGQSEAAYSSYAFRGARGDS